MAANFASMITAQGRRRERKAAPTPRFTDCEADALNTTPSRQLDRRDGVVVRAFASQSVDLGFISQVESYQKTLKTGIHSFPACLLCPWARRLIGCLHLYVADRWWGQAIYSSWWPSLIEDMQTEHERSRNVRTSSCLMLRTNSSNDEVSNFRFFDIICFYDKKKG